MKRTWSVAALVIAAGAGLLRGQSTRPAADVAPIAGDYSIVSATYSDGTAVPAEKVSTASVRIGDGRFSILGPNARSEDATVVRLDPTSSPMQIDLAVTDPKGAALAVAGIYAVDGERLTVCLARPGGERPTGVSGESGKSLFVLERKPAATRPATMP